MSYTVNSLVFYCLSTRKVNTLNSYRLNLATLPAGVSERRYTLDSSFFEAMEQPDVAGADVCVDVCVESKNDAWYFTVSTRGVMQIPCDRCLEPMDLPVDKAEKFTVRTGEEYDETADGLITVPETDPMLDLAPLFCDMMLLAIPMRHVHPAGGCDPAMQALLREHSSAVEDDEEEPEG